MLDGLPVGIRFDELTGRFWVNPLRLVLPLLMAYHCLRRNRCDYCIGNQGVLVGAIAHDATLLTPHQNR